MMNLFTEPGERAKAMGIFGFVMSGGGSLGVLLGGVLTDALNWHWIFLVNVPIGVAVVLLTLKLLPPARTEAADRRLDVAGAVAVTASLMLAVYTIVKGNDVGWLTARTVGLLAASAALLALFIAIESRVRSPLMPLGLFRLRNVATANVVGILWAAAMFAWFFISALYLQLVLGYSPLQVGLAFLPANLIMGAFSIGLSAKLVMRFGFRIPLATGLLVAAAGLVLFARAPVDGNFARRRAPEHDPARDRGRAGVQPGAARRDERRRTERVRPRVGRRQHVVHDGRRARPFDPREPRSLPHRQLARFRTRRTRRTERRLSRRVPRRCRLRGRGRRCRRSVPADERARGWSGAGGSGCALLRTTREERDEQDHRVGVHLARRRDRRSRRRRGLRTRWLDVPRTRDGEIGKFKGEELFASDALLLGRITYEGFAAAWPSRTDEQGFAERMNSLPKFVGVDHAGGGGMAELHRCEGRCRCGDGELKDRPGGDMLVVGQRQARADTRAARPR